MLASYALVCIPGCHFFEASHAPRVHNPFPQLSRVAVAPFFNQSEEPTVDGARFALAYFGELQAVPGFEVVPLGVVEEAIIANQIDLSNPDEVRRLARILNVDVVVIGAVTDYTPYYPPRCGLRVEWYAANPGFHEIPPGYGLPWGTPEEEFIPDRLVFEAEFAVAKAQLKSQTPMCPTPAAPPPQPGPAPADLEPWEMNGAVQQPNELNVAPPLPPPPSRESQNSAGKNQGNDSVASRVKRARYEETAAEEDLPPPLDAGDASMPSLPPNASAAAATIGATVADGIAPAGMFDRSAFMPQPLNVARPPCIPHNGPVMTHTRIYNGHDGDFAEALATYYHYQKDARFGGWQNYLQRSDDFIRFCCHKHIAEMLTARGGGDKTRVTTECANCR